LLASVFVGAGVLHFCFTSAYVSIIPPYLPEPRLLVFMSGVAEVLGGVGLLVTETRRVAAWGLVALLVALMPANVQMALDHERWRSIPEWALWARVPLQLPLIWWAWVYAQPNR
jgi:uncharacterized membrane protein